MDSEVVLFIWRFGLIIGLPTMDATADSGAVIEPGSNPNQLQSQRKFQHPKDHVEEGVYILKQICKDRRNVSSFKCIGSSAALNGS